MNTLKEAESRVISARARHERLAAAFDRGEPVDVLLSMAHTEWVAARSEFQRIKAAQVASS